MVESLRISGLVFIPADAIEIRAVRSSGPGGQNVNKVASKVELRVDLIRIQGLSESARARLDGLAVHRTDAEGRLLIKSQRTRDQHRNLEDAREKLLALVRRALVPPKLRRPTRPTPAARERRLAEKRRESIRKRGRRERPSED